MFAASYVEFWKGHIMRLLAAALMLASSSVWAMFENGDFEANGGPRMAGTVGALVPGTSPPNLAAQTKRAIVRN